MGCSSRSRVILIASATLLATWGCGGTPDAGQGAASGGEATVTGKVTVNGKPAARGRITFEPLGANGLPAGSQVAQVGKDGTYAVTTKAGNNDVTASQTGNPAVDSGYNKMSFEAKPGANTLDLDLPMKP